MRLRYILIYILTMVTVVCIHGHNATVSSVVSYDGANYPTEYEYNANGNMTKDLNKKISSIQYNSLNLPAKITLMDGRTIAYTYGADGKKLRAVYSYLQEIYQPIDSGVPGPMTSAIAEPVGQPSETNAGGIGQELPVLTSTAIDYCGNITYKDGRIEQMLVDGGYVTFTNNNVNSPTYHFYIQDHLGNNRVVVKQDGSVEQVNHYYPYGGLMAENTGHNVQRYKYNGKELDRMHGLDWYDYGARNYDGVLGRWDRIDPLCEKYYNISPYAYCAGNPMKFVDSNGEKINRWRVTAGSNGREVYSPNKTSRNFKKAMRIFGKTKYGKEFIGSFTEKGKNNYGVSGNGKYAFYNIDIAVADFKDQQTEFAILQGVDGFFKIKQGDDGVIRFQFMVNDSGRSVAEILETILHEFCLHGSEITNLIKGYETNGFRGAYNEFLKDNMGKKAHKNLLYKNYKHKGTKAYYKTIKEIMTENADINYEFDDEL